jgi:hypothetical protein
LGHLSARLQKSADVFAPSIERLLSLGQEVMALIDSRNA